MARWTVNRLVRAGARSASGRFALRVARDLGNLQLVDRGMTLAAHVFTSILPILIVAGALRASLDPQTGPIFAEHLGLDEATAEILEKSLPGEAQELRATGVLGVILLVVAATSFARALERSFRTIWRAPTVSIKFAWRWLAALAAVVIGLALVVATRIIVVGVGPIPVIEFIAEVALWGALWWIASWIVINRRVSLRELLPGSVLAGLGFAVAGLFGRVFLPPLLADSAMRFGVLGMAFTYIGWLLVLACILLIAATVGRVAYLTYSGRAWRRSVTTPGGGVRGDGG
ncbi:MAG: YhjD/YihY/BrkB family envelope integrity protein [Microbacterium sp.]